jgi:ribosomal-protein-alanine N-acetyltransferase
VNASRAPHADDLIVRIEPMRRRHLRPVLRIEAQSYPRPWTLGIFLSELRQRETRCYVVARVGPEVVGYGGELVGIDEVHITNLAVDPRWHRHKIATRLLVALLRAGTARGATGVTLEVRESNRPAQELYRSFGLAPVGVRKRYYEQTEDAIVMWLHDIDQPAYAARLASIESALPGTTVVDPAVLEVAPK